MSDDEDSKDFIRVRVASLNNETKEMHVQIKDYSVNYGSVSDILKEIRELFTSSGHTITSLTHKYVYFKSHISDERSW